MSVNVKVISLITPKSLYISLIASDCLNTILVRTICPVVPIVLVITSLGGKEVSSRITRVFGGRDETLVLVLNFVPTSLFAAPCDLKSYESSFLEINTFSPEEKLYSCSAPISNQF